MVKSINWLVAFIMIGPLSSLAHLNGQSTDDTARATCSVADMVVLLKIGVSDDDLADYGDRKGWPKTLTDKQIAEIMPHGPGKRLKQKLLSYVRARINREDLSERYEVFDGRIDADHNFSILKPKGWKTEPGVGPSRRFSFHEHDKAGWFLRTSYFVWLFPIESWTMDNRDSLAQICFDSARSRIAKSGIIPGETTIGRIVDARSEQEFPFIYTLCVDDKTKVKGEFAMALRIMEKEGLMVLMGFSTRVDKASKRAAHAKAQLAEMLASLEIQTTVVVDRKSK